jgi:hypothetical protein
MREKLVMILIMGAIIIGVSFPSYVAWRQGYKAGYVYGEAECVKEWNDSLFGPTPKKEDLRSEGFGSKTK